MKTRILAFITGGYFGWSLTAFANLDIRNWQWWAILAPTAYIIPNKRILF